MRRPPPPGLRPRTLIACTFAVTNMLACSSPDSERARPPVFIESFGVTPTGDSVDIYTVENANGLQMRVMTYGGIILSLRVPDRNGALGDIVLGYDSLDGYLRETPYFGAIVGRYANRIAGARFTLDDATYELAANDGVNHLHGGNIGFDKVVWGAEPLWTDSSSGLTLSHTSPDGDEGYPGTLTVQVRYELTDSDRLIVAYHATTDQATPVNLSQHSYFNLAGGGNILGHELTINADSMTPVDSTLIPTGAITPVAGTPFDFRSPIAIGARIEADDVQLHAGGGYDHNFVLNRSGPGLVEAARVYDSSSGRELVISTTEPGLQFYSGNFLDGSITGKDGTVYGHRSGLCLETQHFPDSPNHPGFPSTILRPGGVYSSETVFAFRVRP